MPIFTRRSRANLLLLPRTLLFLDTLRSRDAVGSGSVAALCSGLCTMVTLMPETALVSLRTLAFFFPLVANTFSSFNACWSLSLLDHFSCFKSPMHDVKVSQSEFLIYTSLYHCLQFLIVGHRHLLMNFHVVQFWYGLELHRLTYSQFVQTFQGIIRWYLWHR